MKIGNEDFRGKVHVATCCTYCKHREMSVWAAQCTELLIYLQSVSSVIIIQISVMVKWIEITLTEGSQVPKFQELTVSTSSGGFGATRLLILGFGLKPSLHSVDRI